MNPFSHRPALDGLRTIAVYIVVLFHAGTHSFQGGFIGVDLFFVLSGFLVTNVLLTDVDELGRIRLWRFYARRARRLIPAATVTIVGTSVAMLLVANQLDRLNVRGDARASSLWFANWHFMARSNDYFAAEEAPSPFLHFWSLSIEEQFYLAYPVVLMAVILLARRSLRAIAPMLAVGTVAGVAVQLYWSTRDLNHAYYGTDARVYQLLAGGALAALLRVYPAAAPRFVGRIGRVAAPLLAAALVAASTSLLDVSPSTRGIVAMLVSVGLIATLETAPGGPANRLLGLRPVTYLGQISYGTYLWHWPVLVVTGRVLELSPSASFLLSAIGGTALAALSYELIEMPIRTGPILHRLPRVTIACGVTAAMLAGMVIAPGLLESDRPPSVASAGTSREMLIDAGPSPSVEVLEAAIDDWVNPPPCVDDEPERCVLVRGSGLRVHVLGDSHARMIVPGLQSIAEERGMQLSATVFASCPWQLGFVIGKPGDPRRARCEAEKPDSYDRVIPDLDPDIIVVMNHPRDKGLGAPLVPIDDELKDRPDGDAFDAATRSSIDALAVDGRRVVMLEPVPVPGFSSVDCMAGTPVAGQCAFRADAKPGMNEVVYRRATKGRDDVFSINLDKLTCPDLPICSPVVDGMVVRNRSHLTGTYVRSLAPEIYDLLKSKGVFDGLDS